MATFGNEETYDNVRYYTATSSGYWDEVSGTLVIENFEMVEDIESEQDLKRLEVFEEFINTLII